MNPKKKRYLLVQIIESKQNMMNAEPFSYLMTMKKKKEEKIWKKNTTKKKSYQDRKTERPAPRCISCSIMGNNQCRSTSLNMFIFWFSIQSTPKILLLPKYIVFWLGDYYFPAYPTTYSSLACKNAEASAGWEKTKIIKTRRG